MNLFQSLILGIVQGFTEFLPVSSSGHIVLLQKIFGVSDGTKTFAIILHLGTLLPVFIVFWKDIWELLKRPFQKYTLLLVIGTIPAVIFALFAGDVIDSMFTTGAYLGVGFLITGILLLYADHVSVDGKKQDKEITLLDSVIVGVFQAIAISPGISRSGATISSSLFRKLDKKTAAKYSFLLSVPAIAGGAVLEVKYLLSEPESFAQINAMNYIVGFLAAALSGYLAINFLLKLIRERKLKYFSLYVFALAVLIFADQFLFKIYFK